MCKCCQQAHASGVKEGIKIAESVKPTDFCSHPAKETEAKIRAQASQETAKAMIKFLRSESRRSENSGYVEFVVTGKTLEKFNAIFLRAKRR
jgi:hypothetical protein